MDLKKIFRAKKHGRTPAKPSNVRTAPLADQQLHDALIKGKSFAPRQLLSACAQSVGKQREHNEDSLLAFSIILGNETNIVPLGLYVVADGMGGYQYGEVASEAAVRSVAGNFLRKFLPFIANPSEPMEKPLQELMQAAVSEAQRIVMQSAPGGGTTLTAALVLGSQVTVAHVGDSRAYILRPDRRIEPLTRDHTLVKRLEELGQITAQEAAVHPQRNVLYRALGQGEALDPDILTAPFPQPGYILLCSDGLWGVLPEEDICQIVYESPDIQTACQNLVQAANEAGGPDNISVILVQLLG